MFSRDEFIFRKDGTPSSLKLMHKMDIFVDVILLKE